MEDKSSNKNKKSLVSVIIPGYNEEAIVINNLKIICDYLKNYEDRYNWEIIFINDGSKDKTGILADDFACCHDNIKIYHHITNLNLGNALKTGFAHAYGKYTITLDLDLSYAPYHIGMLLDTLESTKADIVVASPYMKGGKVTAVPFMRRMLSKWVNKFMRLVSQEKLHTFTGMVRGYRTEFLKSLNLKTIDYEISPEILYKSLILRARIIEIPAHLDWTEQNKLGVKRTSSMNVLRAFFSGLMSGFILRPYVFFLYAGFILLIISLYIIGWIFFNTMQIYPTVQISPHFFDDKFSVAVGQVFSERPYSFLVGGIALIASIQLLALGFISLQKKRYFEELFHINSSILKQIRNRANDENNEN